MGGEAQRVATRRIAAARSALLGALAGVLAGALALAGASRAAFWPLPLLEPATARVIVAGGGAVELALYVPDAPADLGRREALLGRGVDPREHAGWQRARQQAVCPLGVPPLGEGNDWVRVRVERSDALERVLEAGLVLAPLAPPEIAVGESWAQSEIPPLPGRWAPPAFSCAFAPARRDARWIYGDWDGDGAREVGKYVPALERFLLDANGNGRWDGLAGGDLAARVAAAAGPGEPLVGDWNGDGVEGVGKAVGVLAFLDANESLGWDGVAGGDAVASLAPGVPDAVTLVGDWDGDGRDQLGRYDPASGRFLLDANGNGRWDGAAGGDRRVDFPPLADPPAAEPFAADFDGAPGDGVGQAGRGRVTADLDEDGVFAGARGGDLDLQLAASAPCPCGELPPRPTADGGGAAGLFVP